VGGGPPNERREREAASATLHQRPSGFIGTISFLVPNSDDVPTRNPAKTRFLFESITNIDTIEAVTGIDFLPDLPQDREDAVENFKAPGLWNPRDLID
jgi:hypothetical protein